MRFVKTKLGIKSKLQYPLMIFGSDKKMLATVSLPIGVPNVVAKELKSIIDDAIAGSKSVSKVVMIGITQSYSQSTVGGDFEPVYEDSVVAIFDSIEMAESYVEKYKLNKPISSGSFSGEECYSKKSVLSGCCDYRLEDLSGFPVNPE